MASDFNSASSESRLASPEMYSVGARIQLAGSHSHHRADRMKITADRMKITADRMKITAERMEIAEDRRRSGAYGARRGSRSRARPY